MKLYTYFRSSAAYRVRIALALKGIAYETAPIHLARDGGEQHRPDYLSVNSQGLVPTLVDGGKVISQSLAILEYLEETHPQPALLPAEPALRAQVRAVCLAIACDIHPLNNLRVLQYLRNTFRHDETTVNAWYAHWIATGFDSLERTVQAGAGKYAFGDKVTLADVCLVPQMANARRFRCDIAPYPTLSAICDRLVALPAFAQAAPENQPDAEA